MPEMIPVGNTGIQPDPLGSISKMMALRSSQLGIQQQQQNLQTGAYQQQTAQADAQGAQRIQGEQRAAQQLVINGTQSGKYTNPDGSLNRQQLADDIIKVAPTSGQQIAGQLLSQANEIVQNKQATFNLTSDKRQKIGDTIGALASDPGVDHSKVIDAFEGLREQYPGDKEMSRMLQSMGGAIPPSAQGTQLQQMLNSAASSMKATPAVQPGSNAAGQNINRGTFSGQNSLPSGNAPNPTSTVVAGNTAGATAAATGTTNQNLENIENARAAADLGGTSRNVNAQLLKLSANTKTGPGTQMWHNAMGAIGAPFGTDTGSDYQQITAYLDRQAALQARTMGVPNTNAGLASAQGASGTTAYTPGALQEKVKFADALNSGAMAYRQGLDKVVGTGSQPDTANYQAYRSAWARNFDPDVYRAEDAQRRGDQAELAAIQKRVGAQGMKSLATKSANLRQLENGQIPQ